MELTTSLEDQAYKKIKKAISKGYIRKGSKLAEVSLAQSLNMSRATVKGAIKRLVFEGLAEHVHNKGVSVVNPSLEEIRQSFQVRASLEKLAVTLATENLASGDFSRMHELIELEKELFHARELDRYHEINQGFHLTIAEKSGNQVLVHYVKELIQKTTIYLKLFDPFYQLLEANNSSPAEHLELLNLLKKGEAQEAGAAMEAHLKTTLKGIDVERLTPRDYLTV
jgi:DNA-binding GntR family transcriptional regulator